MEINIRNIARMLAPLDDSMMAEFVASLGEINALADRSPEFVWRFQTQEAGYIPLWAATNGTAILEHVQEMPVAPGTSLEA